MTAWSDDILSDMQMDLAITADQQVFTDEELERFYTRAGESYNMALVYAIRALLMDAAKRNSYTVGQTKEEMNDTFDNLSRMLTYFEGLANGAGQAQIVGVRSVPYRYHDAPYHRGDPWIRNWRRSWPYGSS